MGDALALVSAGRTEEAHAAFELLLVDCAAVDDHWLPDVCGAFAALEQQLGHLDEALILRERALREAQRLSGDPHTIAVHRYFLGAFLLQLGRASEVVEVIRPSVGHEESSDRYLLIPFAKALWMLHREGEARSAAMRAIALARAGEQRDAASQALKDILGDQHA
jgi:hypothetical protein